MTTKEEITASMAYEERQAAYRKEDEAIKVNQLAWTEQQRREREGRRVSGMGFFRLVWIVAFGILIAQAIGGLLLWIVASIKTP